MLVELNGSGDGEAFIFIIYSILFFIFLHYFLFFQDSLLFLAYPELFTPYFNSIRRYRLLDILNASMDGLFLPAKEHKAFLLSALYFYVYLVGICYKHAN